MDILTVGPVFLLGFFATFFFVTTGGVGLVTTPSLIMLGLSPPMAVATDLFAMFGGRIGGLLALKKTGSVDLTLALRLAAILACGAICGSFLLISIDERTMKTLLGFFLLMVLLFFLKAPGVGLSNVTPSRVRKNFGYAAFFLVGVWGTLVGAAFIALGNSALVLLFRRTFLESATLMMIVGMAVGIVGLVIYGSSGLINWPIGFSLLAGKALGGYYGARFAVKLGNKWIRYVFLMVAFISAVLLILG